MDGRLGGVMASPAELYPSALKHGFSGAVGIIVYVDAKKETFLCLSFSNSLHLFCAAALLAPFERTVSPEARQTSKNTVDRKGQPAGQPKASR
jgi:hypothetical protein